MTLEILIGLALKASPTKPFLKEIEHKSGKIIQFDRNSLKDFKPSLLYKPSWLVNNKKNDIILFR